MATKGLETIKFKCNIVEDRQVIIALGINGQGKTVTTNEIVFMKKALSKKSLVFVFDTQNDCIKDKRFRGFTRITSFKELKYINNDIIVDLHGSAGFENLLKNGRSSYTEILKDATLIAEQLFKKHMDMNIIFYFPELSSFFPNISFKGDNWITQFFLIEYGRHKNIDIIGGTVDTRSISKSLFGIVDYLLGFKLNEPYQLSYLSKLNGEYDEDGRLIKFKGLKYLPRLKRGQFILLKEPSY